MHFRPEETANFEKLFREVYPKISTFPGCSGVTLLRDINNPAIYFTYSLWNGPDDLERYRNSELFKGTWAMTKILFENKAEAWSVEEAAF
jgi:hypothetical protein